MNPSVNGPLFGRVWCSRRLPMTLAVQRLSECGTLRDSSSAAISEEGVPASVSRPTPSPLSSSEPTSSPPSSMPSPASGVRSLGARLSALAWHSLTIAWGYFLLLSGLVLDALPLAAELFNTPEVQSVVAGIAGPYASHWLKAIGLITVLARMRSLRLKVDAGTP